MFDVDTIVIGIFHETVGRVVAPADEFGFVLIEWRGVEGQYFFVKADHLNLHNGDE